MPMTKFDPQIHGFHFANEFTNHVLGGIITTYGRCGGMAFGALDYFFANRSAPTHSSSDFTASHRVPPDGSPLADAIYARMIDSFTSNAGRWLEIELPTTDPAQFTRQRLPELLGELDRGRPVALGFIASQKIMEIGSNHQVVAFGYQVSGDQLTLSIHDNNYPDRTVALNTNPGNPASIRYSAGDRWIGFFKESYAPKVPDYFDLGLARGLKLTLPAPAATAAVPLPSHPTLPVHKQIAGKPLAATATIKNFGTFAAHLQDVRLSITGPDGKHTLLGRVQHPAALAPGESLEIHEATQAFGTSPGLYEIEARFTTVLGKDVRVPEKVQGTASAARVLVVAPGA